MVLELRLTKRNKRKTYLAGGIFLEIDITIDNSQYDRNWMDALHSSGDDVETKLTISTYFDMLFVGSIYFVSVLSLQVAQSLLEAHDVMNALAYGHSRGMRALLPKLAKLLKDEYNLEKHVREGVKSLEIELTMMHAALRKVAEVPLDQLDDQVKIWASKVREISYDMEDAVDAFMVRVEDDSHSGPSTFKNRVKRSIKKISKLFRKAKELHQIADAIKEAQALAQQMAGAIGSIEEHVVERFVVSTNAFQRATECTFFNFVTVPSMFPRGAMPRVRFLHFSLLAWDNNMAIGNGSRGDLDLAMGHLPSLERVAVNLWCRKASRAEVEAVEAALRRATDVHPNNPTLVVVRYQADHLREQENNLADVEDEKESSPPSVTSDM
uniref:Uncharacterized protein n=1 Tax=Oryza nivara TaxID=4536 RepID=A0A0E0IP90_ORYNI